MDTPQPPIDFSRLSHLPTRALVVALEIARENPEQLLLRKCGLGSDVTASFVDSVRLEIERRTQMAESDSKTKEI